jgi:dTDP-4-amino-4,6-dideoxygalactose transaminase
MDTPVIEGGLPLREDYLLFGRPEIHDEEIDEVVNVLKSGWIGTGPKTKQFEEDMKSLLGCKHAIALNSCTSALHLCLLCSGIGPGDEVIVSPMTFAATVNVIEHIGAKPVFVDIDKSSFNMDPKKIENAITKQTKAILPVHFAGLPCDMDEINSIAKKRGLLVIEDAAHAIGAEYKGKKVGNGENPTCFSFYVTKNVTSAEGGMVTLNDDSLAEKIRIYSLHGLSKHAYQRFAKNASKTYEVLYPGYKYNMTDLNAAIVLHQLKRLKEVNLKRKSYFELYKKLLEDCDLIELPPDLPDRKSSYHLFPILLRLDMLKIGKLEFMAAMDKENIGTSVHYNAIHLEPFYANKYGMRRGSCQRAEYVSDRTVSIPLQSSMSEKDVVCVSKAVIRLLEYYRK